MQSQSDSVLPSASRQILLRPDSADRLEIVTDSAIGLLRLHGAAGLTMRRIANDCEMTIGWLTNRFENKDQLLSLVAMTVGQRWLRWITGRVGEMGILALLPDSEESVPALHVWLTLLNLGREHEGVGAHTASVRTEERVWVATLVRQGPAHHPSPDEVNSMVAVVDGLRVALCSPDDPLRGEDQVNVASARRLLLAQQDAVGGRAGVA